jgi:hypothetical protein
VLLPANRPLLLAAAAVVTERATPLMLLLRATAWLPVQRLTAAEPHVCV